jgi:hypothetical protein
LTFLPKFIFFAKVNFLQKLIGLQKFLDKNVVNGMPSNTCSPINQVENSETVRRRGRGGGRRRRRRRRFVAPGPHATLSHLVKNSSSVCMHFASK